MLLDDVLSATRLPRNILNLLFHSLAFYFFFVASRRILKAPSSDTSPILKSFVLYWMLANAISLPICAQDVLAMVPGIWTWDDAFPYWFWMNLSERSVSIGIPISVFFLTLDRCLTLGLALRYNHARQKALLILETVLITVAVLFSSLTYLVARFVNDYEKPDPKHCWATFCFLPDRDDWQFVARVTIGLLNVACSALFGFLLKRQNAKRAQWSHQAASKSSGNVFVLCAIATELLFNSLPHAACLIYELATHVNIAASFGSVSYTLNSVDGLVCALMYRKVKKPTPKNSTNHLSVHNSNTARRALTNVETV